MSDTAGSRPVTVVGVDGSKESRAALEWAVNHVRRSGGILRAVTAWHVPTSYGYPLYLVDTDLAGTAARVLEDELAAALPTENIEVERVVAEGPAAHLLEEAARGAELLVVGSRGHGAIAGALLGSVSTHCLHHAPCPVVVVR